jgi:AraC-like DNA-binding protein
VWVRTFPVTFLHDVREPRHAHAWHQLVFAVRGHLEVTTDDARRIIPADRAIWIPAGTPHEKAMRAPVSMRSLFVAPGSAPPGDAAWPARARTIAVTPLFRELVLHVSRIGALDRRDPRQARLVGVLFDLLAAADDVPLELRSPRDPRARRFAELVAAEPGKAAPVEALARRAGASLRTLERCFRAETGMAIGEWRRRVRLFHALGRVEAGASITDVAYEVGYATPSAFAVAFKRQFGRPPRATTRR